MISNLPKTRILFVFRLFRKIKATQNIFIHKERTKQNKKRKKNANDDSFFFIFRSTE